MTDSSHDRRNARRAEIKVRLRRVRGAMTDEEFEGLVSGVMRTAERFADIDAGPEAGWRHGSSRREPGQRE